MNNFADAAIVISPSEDQFYKQPMYYAMGHFSKYIPEDSVRIDSKLLIPDTNLMFTAFLRPDGKRAVVIYNKYFDIFLILNTFCSNTMIYTK